MNTNPTRTGEQFKQRVRSILVASNVQFSGSPWRTKFFDDFDSRITTDFLVHKSDWTEGFYIECHFQDSEGSTRNKCCLTKDRALILPHPMLVIASGQLQASIIAYFHKMHTRFSDKVMEPMNLDEFSSFLMRQNSSLPQMKMF